MHKIAVVGLGPGNPDYMLPAARHAIDEADILVGGERNLQSLHREGKETFVIRDNLQEVVRFIRENRGKTKIAVAVSGDPGFYSMLRYLLNHFGPHELNVVPGISSLQYMFSKIGMPWDDACLISLHGREEALVEQVKIHPKVGLLTDDRWPPDRIARVLLEGGLGDRCMYIGENLSCEHEEITAGPLTDIRGRSGYGMAVVVIIDEK